MAVAFRNTPKTTFAQRPAHLRPFEVQWRETGLAEPHVSPIEQKLGRGLLSLILEPAEFGPPAYINLFLPAHGDFTNMPPITAKMQEGVINIMPQAKIGAYICDFAMHVKAYSSRRVVKGAVECDGRDYHDRTDKQIAYDRRRDRFMQEKDICVLRFPGFEIHDNPEKCAREAINVLIRKSLARAR